MLGDTGYGYGTSRTRRGRGNVFTHTIMAITYGAMIANLIPVLLAWHRSATGLRLEAVHVPLAYRLALTALAAGTCASAARYSSSIQASCESNCRSRQSRGAKVRLTRAGSAECARAKSSLYRGHRPIRWSRLA